MSYARWARVTESLEQAADGQVGRGIGCQYGGPGTSVPEVCPTVAPEELWYAPHPGVPFVSISCLVHLHAMAGAVPSPMTYRPEEVAWAAGHYCWQWCQWPRAAYPSKNG